LAQVNCSDDQTRVILEEQFQVPGRTETVRGRGQTGLQRAGPQSRTPSPMSEDRG